MNCLAHAIRFLDEPWFVAGACLPDWLSMCDRKVRLRPKHVDPVAEQSDSSPETLLARGIQQHWHDDEWFHRTPAFHSVTAEVGRRFKAAFDTGDNFRAGFLGHIATELLIDGILSVRQPNALDRYYEAVQKISPQDLEATVNSYGARESQRIAPFLQRYLSDQFLRDYVSDDRLLYRLNRVLCRVRLPELPDAAADVIGDSRQFVETNLENLLTKEFLAGAP